MILAEVIGLMRIREGKKFRLHPEIKSLVLSSSTTTCHQGSYDNSTNNTQISHTDQIKEEVQVQMFLIILLVSYVFCIDLLENKM